MDPFKIFIVEDDLIYAKILAYHFSLNPDYETEIFRDGNSLLKNIYKNPAIITLDYNLPDMSGLEILKRIKEFNKEIPVIIVSGQQDVSTAVNLLKKGAYDYVIKDQDTKDRLWNIARNIREHFSLKQQISFLQEEIGKKYEFNKIIKGESPAIHQVFKLMEKAIMSDITVSIKGDTGTGKELVAKSIHFNSSRKKGPFIAVNVTAIPNDLIEAELFGHEKGAFTGANGRRIGKFEEANNGTIFLDEIGDMDLNMQSKLLRVLQEEEVTRIGSNQPVKLNFRLIVATHRNLMEEVKKGNFREDLYYRILGLSIEMPALRDRANDVILLSLSFIEDFCKKNRLGKKTLSAQAIEKLRSHSYPGNVRELKAVVELACVMSEGLTIEAHDISFATGNSIDELLADEMTLDDYNRIIIHHFLNKYDNKVRKVASKLGIGKTTIYRLLKDETSMPEIDK
ncbi:MAG: sigma-54 dependent transcriptional regulator [Bacteroidota bacterium]|nr:sigma-54 dependent transcriptional regulator [Bacteroidota bacterium]